VTGKFVFLYVIFIAFSVTEASGAVAGDADSNRQAALVQQFRSAVNEQQLLLQARETLARQQVLRERLRKEFAANKSALERLNKRVYSGEYILGEFTGIGIETARIFIRNVKHSIIYAQKPHVLKIAKKIASTSQFPYSDELKEFAREMLRVMSLQGEVARYKATVVMRRGQEKNTPVVRIGSFNVIENGVYLQYLSGYDALVVSPSQPGIKYQSRARRLFSAKQGLTGFGIGPTRGELTGN